MSILNTTFHKAKPAACVFAWLIICVSVHPSSIWHVDASRPDDTGPGTEWGNAFQTIQAAVDAAAEGDTILVTNGTYNTGGRKRPGYTTHSGLEPATNRVFVPIAVNITAVSADPADTVIEGAPDPGSGTYGPSAIRGIYLSAGATLSGFTITNGHAIIEGRDEEACGGGILAEDSSVVVSNCVITGNHTYGTRDHAGGGAYRGTYYDCIIRGNSATGNGVAGYNTGGGIGGAILYRCVIEQNWTTPSGYGGGASGCTLYNCIIQDNAASTRGGGILSSTAYECEFYRNAGSYGGAAAFSEVYDSIIQYHRGGTYGTVGHMSDFYRCEISRNIGSTALARGGYFEACTITHNTNTSNVGMTTHTRTDLVNCLVVSNVAGSTAGTPLFANLTTLVNCTIVFNRSNQGGMITSAHTSTGVTNSIVYYNNYDRNGNYSATSLDFRLTDANLINVAYSCTPILDNLTGPGNITNEPMFFKETPDPFMILRLSPCVDAGIQADDPTTGLAITNDIAGTLRPLDGTGDGQALYDIGAYEYILPPTGTLFFSE